MLPAGKYFIGDPCYVIRDEDWSDILDETRFFGLYATEKAMMEDDYSAKDEQNGIFKYKGHKLAASSTAYGDGEYHSNVGTKFSVDAGLLAAVPMALVDMTAYGDTLEKLGAFVEMEEDFDVDYNDGVITFGHIEIYTGDEDPESENDWWESEEYEAEDDDPGAW